MNAACKLVKHSVITIATILALTFFTKCNSSIATEKEIEKSAVNLANNIDSNSLNLLRKYCYGSRGNDKFWQRVSADTNLYACSYIMKQDTAELTIWRPYNFIKDFQTTFNFDTSKYFQFKFSKVLDTIVKIALVDNHGSDIYKDTSALTKQIFPEGNPFDKFSELTAIRNKYNFIETSYRSDIGDFIEFWLSPQFKLTYLPDTLKMNEKFKKYWLDDFEKGKQIKENWSLQKVYD